jgi:hypothetical protein
MERGRHGGRDTGRYGETREVSEYRSKHPFLRSRGKRAVHPCLKMLLPRQRFLANNLKEVRGRGAGKGAGQGRGKGRCRRGREKALDRVRWRG